MTERQGVSARQFAIGSSTKAFTAATLGTLVHEGALEWNTRIVDVLPSFQWPSAGPRFDRPGQTTRYRDIIEIDSDDVAPIPGRGPHVRSRRLA